MSFVLVFLLVASMLPTTAFAAGKESGWDEVERYILEKTGDTELAERLQKYEADLGRDLTAREIDTWKMGIEVQIVYDRAREEGRPFTQEETAFIDSYVEQVFGTPEERRAYEEQAKREKWEAPQTSMMPSPLWQLPIEIADAANWDNAELLDPSVIAKGEPAITDGGSDLVTMSSSGGGGFWTPGGSYSTPIGAYPTQKGKILVTADWASGLFPTGHAAIVYNGSSTNEWGIIESVEVGVTHRKNDWNDTSSIYFKHTCYGLDVTVTNSAQEAAVAEFCKGKDLLPYNPNFIDRERTDAYYCSQLVWQGYRYIAGVDLDTGFLGDIVYPAELIDSPFTSTVYRHGSYGSSGWNQVNGQMYYLDGDGEPYRGFRRLNNDWYYFHPVTGVNGMGPSYYLVSFAPLCAPDQRIDIPGALTNRGVAINTWQANGTEAQLFVLWKSPGQSCYFIQNAKSGLVLDVEGAVVANNRKIHQWPINNTLAQKWYLESYANGSRLAFSSTLNSSYYMDVAGGASANGTPVVLYQGNGTGAQRYAMY
jgi:hypothetical protein